MSTKLTTDERMKMCQWLHEQIEECEQKLKLPEPPYMAGRHHQNIKNNIGAFEFVLGRMGVGG